MTNLKLLTTVSHYDSVSIKAYWHHANMKLTIYTINTKQVVRNFNLVISSPNRLKFVVAMVDDPKITCMDQLMLILPR